MEIASILEEIQQENHVYKRDVAPLSCFGDDPELDEFMVSYSSFFLNLSVLLLFLEIIFFFCVVCF